MVKFEYFQAPGEPRRVTITFDDFEVYNTPALSAAECNAAILDALGRRNLQAAVFVTGMFVDETTLPLLRSWDERGHIIANHTYSHLSYPAAGFRRFAADVLRNEELLGEFKHFRKLFRFPFLREGDTASQRDEMRAFLLEQGYRNGYVTIDTSDWYIDRRLKARLKAGGADATAYRGYYLSHIRERAAYYDDLARKISWHGIKHTLLLHHNVLNGLFLDDLLGMFEREGWNLIDAEEAYAHAPRLPDVLPAGESVVWGLAKEAGKLDEFIRYPCEGAEYEKPSMDARGL